jgi:hypothetical protein
MNNVTWPEKFVVYLVVKCFSDAIRKLTALWVAGLLFMHVTLSWKQRDECQARVELKTVHKDSGEM